MAELFWPFDPSLVSEWPGTRPEGWADHVGTDFAVTAGTPLRSTMSGVVDIIWNDGLGAWVIDVVSPDGTVARHGHLSAMYPNDGDWVNAGQYIGATGGRPGTPGSGLSTGDHLHWEIRNNTGWGGYGWYDPRDLTIHYFSEIDGGIKPAPEKPTIYGMDDAMIIFYAHALGKDKPGWLVLGFTPNALVLGSQGSANKWAAHIGKPTLTVGYDGFMSYLRAANPTQAQLKNVVDA